eukprot:TRINITY_DN2793_c0_g4_i2.p1 TRINITY_DN2793_c0_g4~~TRINITY_DN2793_c0_g4_i2.p1  ORF type:complete len:174 (+),score=49.71 TRINITY_DN2793_c0_g4_i2:112-633(+)
MAAQITIPRITVLNIFRAHLGKVQLGIAAADRILDMCHEFIYRLSDAANHICLVDHRKTIGSAHILAALEKLGLGDYMDRLCSQYEVEEGNSEGLAKKFSLMRKKGRKRSRVTSQELLEEQEKMLKVARDCYLMTHSELPTFGEKAASVNVLADLENRLNTFKVSIDFDNLFK